MTITSDNRSFLILQVERQPIGVARPAEMSQLERDLLTLHHVIPLNSNKAGYIISLSLSQSCGAGARIGERKVKVGANILHTVGAKHDQKWIARLVFDFKAIRYIIFFFVLAYHNIKEEPEPFFKISLELQLFFESLWSQCQLFLYRCRFLFVTGAVANLGGSATLPLCK